MTDINLETVVEIVKRDHGLHAYVEMTGGGTATIYAGKITTDADGYGRYAAIAGPGWFEGPNYTEGRGSLDDFYIGCDDDGDGQPVATQDYPLMIRDEVAVAKLIFAQSQKPYGTTLSVVDLVAAL